MVCNLLYDKLDYWVKYRAELGDVAYCYGRSTYQDNTTKKLFVYVYNGPDDNPHWTQLDNMILAQYLESVEKGEQAPIEKDTLKNFDVDTVKSCATCEHFRSTGNCSPYCYHVKHRGILVPEFTSCPEYEPKVETETAGATPFKYIRLFLKDAKTGELEIKYKCCDCGKEMGMPYRWWLSLNTGLKDARHIPKSDTGFKFRCEACDKKKEGKI